MSERVAVVGGGISGLSAAYFVLQRGKEGSSVELFESTGQLGGLAASFDFDKLTIEKYYHFICGGDQHLLEFADRLGIRDRVRFRPTRTAFYYNGRYYPFGTPFDLLRFTAIPLFSRFKFGLNVITSRYSKNWQKLDRIGAREWLMQRLGEKAYNVIWDPLLKVKFAHYHDKISAAWIWHRIHRVASSRSGRAGLFSKEKMGYFEGGSQTLISAIQNAVERLGGLIHLNCEIRTVEKNQGRFRLVLDSGQRRDFDRVVLAVPLPAAAKLVQGLDAGFARELAAIDFIGVVCGVFRLRQSVTDAFWLNINDPRIAANGLIEYTNLNPLEEISSDRIVYVPFYLPLDNEMFSMDEKSARSVFFEMLRVVNPGLTEDAVAGFRVFKSPHAQAICTVGFKDRVPPVAPRRVENLFLLDSTQLYPSDRTLSALIGLAQEMAENYF